MKECIVICYIVNPNLLGNNSSVSGPTISWHPTHFTCSRLPIDEDDVGLIFDDLYRGRSAVPPHEVPQRPTIVRWDFRKSISVDNCVVFEFKDAEKHAKACWSPTGDHVDPDSIWEEAVQDTVKRRAAEARRVMEWVM